MKDFLDKQAKIIKYLELISGDSVEQVSIRTEYCTGGHFMIIGTSGYEGDQWSDDSHEHASAEVPMDFFENFDHYLQIKVDERDARLAEQQAKREAAQEKREREQFAQLLEKYGE